MTRDEIFQSFADMRDSSDLSYAAIVTIDEAEDEIIRLVRERDAAEHVLRCYEMDGPIAFKSALKAHRANILKHRENSNDL